ncbi:MAG TPA: SoxR reducing system RseC family protein [Hyphomicrobiales bacterium]|nr:SoxR reducing system RseC family protein [Hyphomicrobiales bacterium]
MLSEPAVVTTAGKGSFLLKTDRADTCAGCSLKRGCGQRLPGAPQSYYLELDTDCAEIPVAEGQAVKLAMSERGLLVLCSVFYLLPLVALLLALVLAWQAGAPEWLQIALAFMGLAMGMAGSRWLLRHAPLRRSLALRVVPAGEKASPAPLCGESRS